MLKKIIISVTPRVFRLYVLKLKLLLSNPYLWRYWNCTFAIEDKPILLLSMPRSGSSWLGEVLAQQDDVRYLREPITSEYMASLKSGPSFFMPSCCKKNQTYQGSIEKAFTGILNFPNSVIQNPSRWCSVRDKKKLLIKEVNPLFLDFLLTKFDLKIIYLERCAYATAKSFHALGWESKDFFSDRFDKATLQQIFSIKPDLLQQDFYFQMGFLQGIVLAINKPHINDDNVLRVKYESVIASPLQEIIKITNFLNYQHSEKVCEYLLDSLSCETSHKIGSFSTQRNSNFLLEKQLQEQLEPNYSRTMAAFNLAYEQFKSGSKQKH
ncbi:sulfotransferase [Pseudoalteromonas distincta]|uniref:sulfotransferase n=1 Tax=Pseudoalteromonas distincta TaxID=77608 RepID=UPI00186A8E2A|nr:sulfotransferase [Pseudoalteromonas distincta]MBE3672543.1 hypothetical protein [Pseudoalteromonas distincta KMM 3548]MDC3212133.1 sulfotransferase [Pseudoalteromonas distincta]